MNHKSYDTWPTIINPTIINCYNKSEGNLKAARQSRTLYCNISETVQDRDFVITDH